MESYKAGSWWYHCPVCGFKYRAEETKLRWDGEYVCKADWEPRHPLDFLKGRDENIDVPYSNEESVTIYMPAIAGIAIAGQNVSWNE
jgi:hypothetical protein